MALLNSITGKPAKSDNPAAEPSLDPQAASTNAQHILSHRTLLSCITRLDLQGVLLTPPLLQAMQGLPALTHLHLSNIRLPPSPSYPHYKYQPGCLPQGVHTLSIKLDTSRQPRYWHASLMSLLTEFIVQGSIEDLTIDTTADSIRGSTAQVCLTALNELAAQGQQVTTLRRLSLPDCRVGNGSISALKHYAPLLEELQVFDLCGPFQREHFDGNADAHLHEQVVSWRTLRVEHLDLTACRYLPLGGTQPLEIHVSGHLGVGATASHVRAGISHLMSPQTRPVRLVGRGADGGSYEWNNWYAVSAINLVTPMSVLQLSKAPVRRLHININPAINVDGMLLALQPLQSLTHLSLRHLMWDGFGQDTLLAQLPLHVQHVRLEFDAMSRGLELFKRMAVVASTVPPGRQQASPLHLCVAGMGPGSEVWEAVEECRARGDMGVVMEEDWE